MKKPATLKRVSRASTSVSQKHLERELPEIKAQRLRELEYRLELFKKWEAERRAQVSGLDIEHALRDVAKWCGAKKRIVPRRRVTKRRGGKERAETDRRAARSGGEDEDVLYGIASEVTMYFGPEARRVLLGWLLDIEESMRWDPRRYWHALHPEEVERMVAQNRTQFDQSEGND